MKKMPTSPGARPSITKIMTLILIFDALKTEPYGLEDEVVTQRLCQIHGRFPGVSGRGRGADGGDADQMHCHRFGNDASVAMAEYIAGTGRSVCGTDERTGQRAWHGTYPLRGLLRPDGIAGPRNTTARDIAIMSRELINRYPKIHEYATVWMDTITHVTRQGTKEFGLAIPINC